MVAFRGGDLMPVRQTRAKRQTLLSVYMADVGQMVSRKRSEEALRAAAIEAATASRAKSEFLANMSHELRTPLNAIIGFGELIGNLAHEKKSAGKPREYAAYIADAGTHLLHLINDILCMSKIESGGLALQIRPLDVRDTIEGSVILLRRRTEEKRQQLLTEMPGNLPYVLADELRLKQIIINLLSNAHKFTGEGGNIQVSAAARGANKLAISVADTGRGMTEEEIAHCLKPFTQARSHLARDQEGTGLGLSITKALVEKHGGTLEIKSTPQAGTIVTFTLPIATGAELGFTPPRAA
jgi:two-component system cell cycle sensor histidine kinase PleC